MPNPSRPIEPGCLCLIISSEFTPQSVGKQCVAEKLLPTGTPVEYREEVYETNCPVWLVTISTGEIGLCPPHTLLRIDGHKPEPDELLATIPALSRQTR